MLAERLTRSIISNVVFPIHEKLKRHDTVKAFRWLSSTQNIDQKSLEKLVEQRLARLLEHAYKNVPYYQDCFSARGLNLEDLKSPHDLAKLPFLTKELITENIERLKARDFQKLKAGRTSGSTGNPLVFYLSNERISHDVAARWRATRWWGVGIGDRELVFWAAPRDISTQGRLKRLRDWLLRSIMLDATVLTEKRMRQFMDVMNDYRPTMIFGYTAAIVQMASFMLKNNLGLTNWTPKVVFVTTEKLMSKDRSIITQAFGAPVADEYGGRDSGFIAHECPEGSMHITAENIIVEIVRDDGTPCLPGEPGEIVITHLASFGFPFIRYRNGDLGVMSDKKCPCGMVHPVLEEVYGRTNDVLINPNGDRFHYTTITHILRNIPGLRSFKVIQSKVDYIQIQLQTYEPLAKETSDLIAASFEARLGGQVSVDVISVEELGVEPTGKRKHVVNHVLDF